MKNDKKNNDGKINLILIKKLEELLFPGNLNIPRNILKKL